MKVVKAAAVQISLVLYSRDGTVEKWCGRALSLANTECSSQPGSRASRGPVTSFETRQRNKNIGLQHSAQSGQARLLRHFAGVGEGRTSEDPFPRSEAHVWQLADSRRCISHACEQADVSEFYSGQLRPRLQDGWC